MQGCKPLSWLKIYDIHGRQYLGQVPGWFKNTGPKAGQLSAALEGVRSALLYEYFKGGSHGPRPRSPLPLKTRGHVFLLP